MQGESEAVTGWKAGRKEGRAHTSRDANWSRQRRRHLPLWCAPSADMTADPVVLVAARQMQWSAQPSRCPLMISL